MAARLMPNCSVPWVEAAFEALAVIVNEPDVNVAPATVIAYPLPALVAAPNCEVPEPVVEVESVPKLKVEPVAPEQLLLVIPEVAEQNVSVSSTLAETVIWLAVLAATTPLSSAPVQLAAE